jgi:hypothetical protein
MSDFKTETLTDTSKEVGLEVYAEKTKYKRSDDKVRELAAVCLPWQQWAETSVWFDDVGISAFHSCVVVDL